jgi:hypothetical protein
MLDKKMKNIAPILIGCSLCWCSFTQAETSCKNAIEKSSAIILSLVADINKTYTFNGGGGISEIKEIATGIYRVSLPQEERIDQFQYQIEIDTNCKVTIIKKESITKSF